jgi:outer membrane immunogenic protein
VRKFLGIFGVSISFIAGPLAALAADMPLKAKALPPAPVMSWTGFYVGVDGGYGWDQHTGSGYAVTAAGVANGFGTVAEVDNVSTARGGFAGGTAGYNYQSGMFVYGIETDIQWSGIGGTGVVADACCRGVIPSLGLYGASEDLNWFGTARGRVGWLASPNLLLFGTGGAIYGQENVSATVFIPSSGHNYPSSDSSTRVGWTAGAGLEYMFAPNWSAKIEGLYYDMGSEKTSFLCPTGATTCSPGFTEVDKFAFRGVLVRAGVNWHFNWAGGPVVARY